MKGISTALKNHLAGSVTTLATLWRITRTDGLVFRFTDHDEDIVYQGETYSAASGFTASAIRTSAAFDVDNMEVEGMLSSDAITDADLIAGLWDHAEFVIMRVNYADLTMGHEVLRAGTFGNVRTGRGHFSVELRGITQALQQSVGRVYTPACDANLGDARCGINLSSWTVTGTVTAVTSQSAFSDSSRTEPAGHFNYGLLTFTSGNNAGHGMEVKSFNSGTFVLQQSMPFQIMPGDAYTVYAGCDKRLSTCSSKFSNVVNFRGFPHVPGIDRMVSGQ